MQGYLHLEVPIHDESFDESPIGGPLYKGIHIYRGTPIKAEPYTRIPLFKSPHIFIYIYISVSLYTNLAEAFTTMTGRIQKDMV